MQVEKKSVSNAKTAKDYLSKNDIPQLFECLMTGLMYNRPADHISYLQDCLERIKKLGMKEVRWDMFLQSKKTPLPPIEATPREDYRPQILPDIGNLQLRMAVDASVVIIQAGPGMDKKAICKNLSSSFPNYISIEFGTYLREKAWLEAQNTESRWKYVRDMINDGDLAPDDFAIEVLIKELNKYPEEKHFFIDGFPRTTKEREHFERFIGFNRLKFMLLVDCEEDVCHQRLVDRGSNGAWSDHNSLAINKRILNYKTNTLAVCKYFDDQDKLRVVDGDRSRELAMKDVHLVFTKEMNEAICPHPPLSPKGSRTPDQEPINEVSPGREPVTEIRKLTNIAPEQDRNPELPQCRLAILLGGPGSGKSEVAARVCIQHPSWIHVDVNELIRSQVMNVTHSPDHHVASCADNPSFVEDWTINLDVLKEALKSIPRGTEIIILEGFPKNSQQLNQFNTEIGRADFVILLDSEEDSMRGRISERFCRTQGVEDDEINSDLRIHHFKTNGLSLCRYYDEMGKMCIVGGDRDILDVASELERLINVKLEVFNNSERLHKNDEKKEKTIGDDQRHAAATKIQASVRGYLVRKQNNNNSSSDMDIDVRKDDEENQQKVVVEESEKEDNDDDKLNLFREDEDQKTEEMAEKIEKKDIKEEQMNEDDVEFSLFGEEEDANQETNNIKDENILEERMEEHKETMLGNNGVHSNSQLELMDAHVILLLGGPGSGKTTLGNNLVSKLGIPFIDMDQIIRNAIESGHEESDHLKKYLSAEDCDETPIYSLLRKSMMDSISADKVMIVAGFPWTVHQYRRFVIDVCRVSATILLDVDEETLKHRILSRDGLESDASDTALLHVFIDNFPALLDVLNENELFFKVDGTQELEDVIQQVSDFIETFDFFNQGQ